MIWNFLIPHIKDLQKKGISVECACSKTGFYYGELETKYNFIMHEIKFVRNPYTFSNLKCLWQLISLIKLNGFDVIHCHEPVGGAMGRIAGFLAGCKVIYTAHGFHFYKGNSWYKNLIYRNVESFLSRFTDVLITINDEDYNAAKKFPIKKKGNVYKISGIGCDIKKIHNCNVDYKKKRNELGIPLDAFVVITVAELIPRKNVDIGIKAYCEAKLKGAVYIICGDGKDEKRIHKLINGRKDIKLLGFRKDIMELNAIADVFLFPSKQEGLSIAVIEGMAAGLPMVVSDARGVKDCVKDGGGIVCKKNDYKQFAEALRMIYKNVDNGLYHIVNKDYSKKYDIDIILNKMHEIYRRIE